MERGATCLPYKSLLPGSLSEEEQKVDVISESFFFCFVFFSFLMAADPDGLFLTSSCHCALSGTVGPQVD